MAKKPSGNQPSVGNPTPRGGKKAIGAATRPSRKLGITEAKKPPNPPRAEIKPQVIAVIDAEAARNSAPPGNRTRLRAGDETVILESDLNINLNRRKALSLDYSAISTAYDGGTPVGPTAAGAATTSKAAIDLVHSHT